MPEGGHLVRDQALDSCFRMGITEYKVYPRVRLQ